MADTSLRPFNLPFSFEDSADEKCKENLDAAVATDPKNPEAHQLMASYWLSKDEKEVSWIESHTNEGAKRAQSSFISVAYFGWRVHMKFVDLYCVFTHFRKRKRA